MGFPPLLGLVPQDRGWCEERRKDRSRISKRDQPRIQTTQIGRQAVGIGLLCIALISGKVSQIGYRHIILYPEWICRGQ